MSSESQAHKENKSFQINTVMALNMLAHENTKKITIINKVFENGPEAISKIALKIERKLNVSTANLNMKCTLV